MLLIRVFCKTWDVMLPRSLIGISHSCVVVPCSYSVPDDQETKLLNCSNRGIWKKGSIHGANILNSRSPSTNVIEGQVVGDLTKKNCTTVFHNIQKDYSDTYYFRLDCPTVQFTFVTGVSIEVQTDPAPPQFTFVGQLSDGAQVRLQCSVPAPCSSLPPTFTWLPRDSSRQEETQTLQNSDGQTIMTSTLTFTASADHHKQNITCSVSYPLSTGGSTNPSEATQTLNVLYAPRFTVATLYTSGPVSEGRTVTFACSTDANPPVSRYTWFNDNSRNLIEVGGGETLVLQVSQQDSGVYLCEAQNSRGSQRSRPVSLKVSTATDKVEYSLTHTYIISGVVLVLYIITVTVTVYKYKSLSRRLKTIEQKGENTYINLKTCRCSAPSDYDQLQPKTKPTPEASDYENIQVHSKDQLQTNQV
ncbi:sialoadhesin-like isoform X2 [Anabas testudineus]|uniref:sialoadhesin-like isoform X2 n=1 Tax=Anabas testudineus TaxID=64144 RepID=UPI000E4635F6|nr:sialoadhesin-like isoform X2 [Anabas testudineus]